MASQPCHPDAARPRTQLLAHVRARHAAADAREAESGHELTRLRTTLRRQLADLPSEGRVDFDCANSLLGTCHQPLLHRSYTVHVKVPFAVRVSAQDDEDAYRLAAQTLDQALIPDGDDIDARCKDVGPDGADPGGIDTGGIDTTTP